MLVTDDHLGDLLEQFHKIAPRWRILGQFLQVPEHQLDLINLPPDHAQCMHRVLLEWVQQRANEATLKSLCDALKSHAIDEKLLANRISRQGRRC